MFYRGRHIVVVGLSTLAFFSGCITGQEATPSGAQEQAIETPSMMKLGDFAFWSPTGISNASAAEQWYLIPGTAPRSVLVISKDVYDWILLKQQFTNFFSENFFGTAEVVHAVSVGPFEVYKLADNTHQKLFADAETVGLAVIDNAYSAINAWKPVENPRQKACYFLDVGRFADTYVKAKGQRLREDTPEGKAVAGFEHVFDPQRLGVSYFLSACDPRLTSKLDNANSSGLDVAAKAGLDAISQNSRDISIDVLNSSATSTGAKATFSRSFKNYLNWRDVFKERFDGTLYYLKNGNTASGSRYTNIWDIIDFFLGAKRNDLKLEDNKPLRPTAYTRESLLCHYRRREADEFWENKASPQNARRFHHTTLVSGYPYSDPPDASGARIDFVNADFILCEDSYRRSGGIAASIASLSTRAARVLPLDYSFPQPYAPFVLVSDYHPNASPRSFAEDGYLHRKRFRARVWNFTGAMVAAKDTYHEGSWEQIRDDIFSATVGTQPLATIASEPLGKPAAVGAEPLHVYQMDLTTNADGGTDPASSKQNLPWFEFFTSTDPSASQGVSCDPQKRRGVSGFASVKYLPELYLPLSVRLEQRAFS